MNRPLYGERDYAFGQLMLTLRTNIGLTQAGLADLLHVSRNAVGGWEAGQSYPKAEYLKHLIALGVQQQAFAAGHEEEEIRALWNAAHQKVLLDEPWLQELLSQQAPSLVDVAVEQTRGADRVSVPQAWGERRVDWGEALDVPSFYGREEELALLSRWVGEQRCRVVSVLGMGGIGKSALAVTVMPPPVPRCWMTACRCWPPTAAGPAGLPGRTPASADGAAARSACAPGAGQSGDALGGRGGHGPHACRL